MLRLLEARQGKTGKREYVQVLRLLERFEMEALHNAVKDALQMGAISFDAIKHLVLCRVERRQARAALLLNAQGRTMKLIVEDWIDPVSTLITDKISSYKKVGT